MPGRISPTSGGGASIRTVGSNMGLVPRAWGFGSRRALNENMYFAMQYAAYAAVYLEKFEIGMDADQRDLYAWGSTFAYGLMGIGASTATLAGAVATGQWWYAGLALAAIPLQLDHFFKTLDQIETQHNVRKYYERRQKIIAEGLHR